MDCDFWTSVVAGAGGYVRNLGQLDGKSLNVGPFDAH